jgi:hypothetical protein
VLIAELQQQQKITSFSYPESMGKDFEFAGASYHSVVWPEVIFRGYHQSSETIIFFNGSRLLWEEQSRDESC